MKNQNLQSSDRKLAAILFADIVGYTSLMQTNEQEGLTKLNRFKSVLENKVPKFRGKIANFYGDGCLAVFDSSVDATNCALELQVSFKEDVIVPVRIGLHSGGVVFKEGNAFGDAVNIASRVESLGIPGAVLLSSSVRNQIKNQPDFQLESLGRFEFKNVAEGMTVYALANEGFPIPKREEIKGKLKPKSQELNDGFFQRIWRKKVPQIFTAYLVIGWILVQMTEWGLNQFGISPHWSRILFIIILGIIPSLLVYLISREQIHNKVFTRKQKILFPTNFILLGAVLFFMFRTAELGATSKDITFINADGQEETRNVIKEEFRIHIPIYPFEQIQEDSTHAWLGAGFSSSIALDMLQDKYIQTRPSFKSNLTTVDKINDAKLDNGDFYIDGTYQFLAGKYQITPTLRNRRNGNVINERTFTGGDFFSLIDSMSLNLRSAVGLSHSQIEESVDLDFKEWNSDNLDAIKEITLHFQNNLRSHLERAVELDSTYVVANIGLAMNYHINSKGKLESKLCIDRAMRHRRRLPFQYQIMVIANHHLIHEEWEKAEKLLKMQLEIEPNNPEFNAFLIGVYWQTGQVDKIIELAENNFSQNPNPMTGFQAMQAALMKGEPDRVIRITKGFLLLDQQNTAILNLLAKAYIHKKDYDSAKETIEKIILIDPEAEKTFKHLLGAINFMKANPDYSNIISMNEGIYRNTYGAQVTYNHMLNDHMYGRSENQFGQFMYPTGDNTLVTGSPTFAYKKEYLLNDDGEVYATKNYNIRRTSEGSFFTWKQDSVIWKAEKLLKEKDYKKALPAYELAIEKYPSHFYLHQAKRHLEFVASISNEELLNIYRRVEGKYGKVKIIMKNDQIYWKQIGIGRELLLPISDHEFIILEGYAFTFAFEEKNGEIDAFQEYKYNLETEVWEKQEDWYFKKEKLLD